jgi:osmotically-inducible protein OsmY
MNINTPKSMPSTGTREGPTDMEIEEAARRRLFSLAFPQLCVIQCECRHGTLILQGRLQSYFLRKLVEESVQTIAGVKNVIDRVDVILPSRFSNF